MAGGLAIAEMMVKLSADVSDLTKGFDLAEKKMSSFEKGMGGLQSAVGAGLKMAAGVGVAAIGGLTAGMVKAVSGAADLEQTAANITAVFTDMSPPIEDVKGLINTLALDPTLIVGVKDAGAGIEMLAKNGLTWSEIADGAARSSILLANATGVDLARSADITTNAMGVFGLEVSDLNSVVATFTNAANKSQFTVDDWGYVLANAGPKANTFGISLEELFAAVSLTSSGFASGQTAGTSWAWMLNGLVPNTEKAKGMMQELGLITADGANQFFKADGTGKNLAEVIKLLQDAFGKLTVEQQMSYSRTIFGNEAYGALSGILGINIDQLNELIPTMTDFSAVEEGAIKRNDTLTAAMAALHDTIDSVFTIIGDKFLPVLTDMVRAFTAFIKDNAQPVIDFFGAFADRVTAFIPLLGTMNLLYGDGSGLLMELTTVFGVSREAAQKFWAEVWSVKQTVDGFIQSVKNTFAPIVDIVKKFVSWQDVLNAVGVVIASVVIPAIGAFLAAISPAIVLFAALVTASAVLRDAWKNDWFGIRTTTEQVWGVISGVFDAVMLKVGWIVDRFKTHWAILTNTNATLGEKLSLIWNMIKDVAVAVWQGIVTTVQILMPKFVTALTKWGEAAWEWVVEAAPIALQKVQKLGTDLWTWVQNNASVWGGKLKEWGDLAWQEFAQRFPQTASTMQSAFETTKAAVTTALSYLGTRFGALGSTIQTFGMGALREIGAWLTGSETDFAAVNKIVDATKEAFGKMWDDFAERFPATAGIVNAAWIAVSNSTKTAWEYVTEKSAGLVEAITTFGMDSLGEIVKWATGNETEFTATTAIWTEFGLMTGDVSGDIIEALVPVGKWLGETLPQSVQASTTALAQLEQAWRDLTGQTEESAKATTGEIGGLMGMINTLIDSGLAVAISRVGTFAANFGQMIVGLRAAATGDWEGMWNAIKTIQVNTDAQVIREAEITVGALKGIMEKGGEDTVDGFNRGISKAMPRTTTTMNEFSNSVGGRESTFFQEMQFGSPSKLFEEYGGWTIEGFVNGITKGIPLANSALGKLAPVIKQAIQPAIDVGANQGRALMQGIDREVGNGMLWVTKTLEDGSRVWENIVTHRWIDVFSDAGQEMMRGLGEGVQSGMLWVKTTLENGVQMWKNTMDGSLRPILNDYNKMIADAAAAESQARAAWEKTKMATDEAAASAAKYTAAVNSQDMTALIKDLIAKGQLNPAHFPVSMGGTGTQVGTGTGGEIILAPTPTPSVPIPTTPPIVAPPVVDFNTLTTMTALGDVLGGDNDAFRTIAYAIQDFGEDINSLLPNTLSGKTDEEKAAISTLIYDPLNKRIDTVLAAVQTLVQAIISRGLGSQINVAAAPGDAADNREELQQLVSYLNALYAN